MKIICKKCARCKKLFVVDNDKAPVFIGEHDEICFCNKCELEIEENRIIDDYNWKKFLRENGIMKSYVRGNILKFRRRDRNPPGRVTPGKV